MLQSYQACRVPQKWLDANFRAILRLCETFVQEVPTNEHTKTMFGNRSTDNLHQAVFVNWKLVYVLMLLGGSARPTSEQMDAYIDKVAEREQPISLNDFLEVSF